MTLHCQDAALLTVPLEDWGFDTDAPTDFKPGQYN